MKTCSKCKTKNDDSSRFCKECGGPLSGSAFQDKKEKVLGEKRKPPWVIVSLIVVAVALAGVAYWVVAGGAKPDAKIGTQGGPERERLYRADHTHGGYPGESGKGENFHSA